MSREPIFDWNKPFWTRRANYPAELLKMGSGNFAYPKLVVQKIYTGFQTAIYTDDGKFDLTESQHPLDLVNIPEPPKAEPLSDEQMAMMVGKIVREGPTLKTVGMFDGLLIKIAGVPHSAKQLLTDCRWPNGKLINSHYPPTLIDFDSQHQDLTKDGE